MRRFSYRDYLGEVRDELKTVYKTYEVFRKYYEVLQKYYTLYIYKKLYTRSNTITSNCIRNFVLCHESFIIGKNCAFL